MKNSELKYYSFDNIFTMNHLWESYKRCRKGTSWKAMVQKFNSQANINIYKLYKKLKERKWKHGKYYDFDRIENGKKRHIQAEYFNDRVVQRCLCDYSLIPILSKKFIYDNSASQKDKGIDFAIRRCKMHLQKHVNKYGNDGYVLQFDFHHYFESIDKSIITKMLDNLYLDKDIFNVAYSMIEQFEKGLGLGSQLSQTLALYFPNRLDHKIKEYFRMKFYGRYMDDGYIISNDKQQLNLILDYIRKWSKEYKIPLNENKTQIIKLSKGFTFLKKSFKIVNNKIIVRVDKKNIHRMKRKLKSITIKLERKDDYILQLWKSWNNSYKKYNCYKQLYNIKRYLDKLMEEHMQTDKQIALNELYLKAKQGEIIKESDLAFIPGDLDRDYYYKDLLTTAFNYRAENGGNVLEIQNILTGQLDKEIKIKELELELLKLRGNI